MTAFGLERTRRLPRRPARLVAAALVTLVLSALAAMPLVYQALGRGDRETAPVSRNQSTEAAPVPTGVAIAAPPANFGSSLPAVEPVTPEPANPAVLEARLAEPLRLHLPAGEIELPPETWQGRVLSPAIEPGEAVRLDRPGVRPALARLAERLRLEPVNARLEVRDQRLAILTPGAPGREVRLEALIDGIERQLPRADRRLDVPFREAPPAVRAETLGTLGIREVLGEGFTSYARDNGDRSYNVELAASRLNGLVIAPGEVFSFNRALGRASVDNGFRWGWGIVSTAGGHRMVPAEAGGICQVATTLLQAVFWSGLEIVERHPHSFWIENYGLLPFGRRGLDATVDDASGADLRFRNTTGEHILLRALVHDAGLQFQILGTRPDWQVVVGEPAISHEIAADYAIIPQPTSLLAAGEERWLETAGSGFRAVLHRTVTAGDGRILQSDTLDSTYVPSRNVLGVGRAEPIQPASTP